LTKQEKAMRELSTPAKELKNFGRALTASVAWVDLERAFEQLPCDLRSALFLHVNEQHCDLEVAELTGRSVGASKSQVHRGRRRLEKYLNTDRGKQATTMKVRASS